MGQDHQPSLIGELVDGEIEGIVQCHPDIVGVDLDELHPQLVEAPLLLRNDLVGIEWRDKGSTDEAIRPFPGVLRHQIVASIGIAVDDAVETGDVDTRIIHTAQVEVWVVLGPVLAPVPQVSVKVDDWSLHHHPILARIIAISAAGVP